MLPDNPVKMKKIIAIACDHAGFDYKETIKAHLISAGFQVEDFGTHSTEPVDYPDFIRPAAQAVSAGSCNAGIVLGGSGNGEAMVANKVPGIRCALCWNQVTGRLAKEEYNCNMISIGQRTLSADEAITIVEAWLHARFLGGKYRQRIDKIDL